MTPPATLERAPARATARTKPPARSRKAEPATAPQTASSFSVSFTPEVEAGLRQEAEACHTTVPELIRVTIERNYSQAQKPATDDKRFPGRGLVAALEKLIIKRPPDFDWKEDVAQALEEKYGIVR